MDFNNKLEKNIGKDYLFTFISRFDLTNGIWMLYLAFRGLTLFQIGLMETVYHISSFTMEIPTGAIADIFGRKTSRVLGRISSVIATLIMIFGNSVFAFALSFIFTALSNNLESGAGEALVYDSLKEIKNENLYMRIRGRNELFYQLTKTISLILGGYIATTSTYTNVYKFACVVSIVSVIQALRFTEPTIGKVERAKNLFDTFTNQIKSSIKAIRSDKRIVEMIVVLEIFSTLYTTEFYYLQNRLKNLGHTELQIGIILACGAGLAALLATQTYRLERKFKLKGILTVAPILAVFAFWGMTIEGIEKYAFIILSGIEGVLFVSMGDFINKLIPSQQRATILSLQSMIFSIFMIILFPVVGILGDSFGLSFSFKVIASLSSAALLSLVYLTRKKQLK